MDSHRPLPAAFFGHGAPLNTLARNAYTDAWRGYAATLPRPRAVAVVSAHWYVPGTRVTAAARPATVHDFNARFPAELFAFTYPAPSDASLVERIAELLAPTPVTRDETTWGIDHGAFSVLAHLYPQADVPIVQISVDRAQPPAYHYALAQRLAPLRDEGVFVMASGNIVHNLELAVRRPNAPMLPWAQRFDERVADLIEAGDHEALVAYQQLGADARLAVPTPDHYLPLLYILGLQRSADRITPIVDGGSAQTLSMRSFGLGA